MTRARRALAGALLAGPIVLGGEGGVAWALDGPSPAAATADTVKLPDAPGSVHGLSDEVSATVFSGQVSYAVPLELPKGPGGFGPGLSLAYAGELGNGPIGIGWTIGEISIRRSLRHGVPTYTSADELEIQGVGPVGRLVPLGANEYRVEGQGNRIRVIQSGSRFDVTDADGTSYALGVTSASREEEGGRTSAWLVESIVNLAGRQIAFTYDKDQNRLYLRQIRWAPGEVYRVDLTYEGRTDQVTSYRTGFARKCARRLTQVAVSTSFGQTPLVLRTYHLSYDASFAVSRLATIHMVGDDGTTALPDLNFQYEHPELAAVTQPPGTGGWALNQRDVSFVDVDGDGAADLLRLEAGNHSYRPNQGDQFGGQRPMTGADNIDMSSGQLLDLDGDSRPELVQVVDNNWHYYTLVAGNWIAQGIWPGTAGIPLHDAATVFCDLNADGRADVVRAGTNGLMVYLNGPSGFAAPQLLPPVSPADSSLQPGQPGVHFTDVNGDGVADVVWLTDAWMKIFLGRGDGTFVLFNRVLYPWGQGLPDPAAVQLADLNRDGLMDVVRVSGGYVYWYPGNVDGTLSDKVRHIPRPEGTDIDAVVTTADANGNGSIDLVWSSPRGLWVLDLAGPTSAGMLNEIDNGLGQTTHFEYRASAALATEAASQKNPWSQNLPVVVPVVVTIRTDPGAGGLLRVRHYGVRDGFWDGSERRLGGFLQGTETTEDVDGPIDALVKQTQFHPGLGSDRVLRGQPTDVRITDGVGNLFVTTKTDWQAIAPTNLTGAGPLGRRAVTTQVDVIYTEGVSSGRVTRTTFTNFDAEGRPAIETRLGLIDASGDEQLITRSYADQTSPWVRERLVEETTTDLGGALATSARHYFGNRQGNVFPLGQLGEGFSRETDVLTGPGGRWVAQVTADYDTCGNQFHVYREGVHRTLGYDRDCLHVTSESLDPGNGAEVLAWSLIWDNDHLRPRSQSDPNGSTLTFSYDALNREVATAIDNNPAHEHVAYDWTPPLPKTTTWMFDGTTTDLAVEGPTWPTGAHWRSTTAVANGAGEPLYSSTPLDGQFIISGWKERDERGQVVRTAEPFFSSTSTPTSPGTPRVVAMDFDAQRRLRTETLANGATKSIVYRALGQTTTTSDLGPITSELDGLLRIVHTDRDPGNAAAVEAVDATYDPAGRVTDLSLGGGSVVHSYTYDGIGRLTAATDPDIGDRTLFYNDQNFLTQLTNGVGQSVFYDYDGAGRVVRRGETPAPSAATDYTYTYDTDAAALQPGCFPASRLAGATEPQGAVRFCYDSLGRSIGMSRTVAVPDAPADTGSKQDTLSLSGLLLVETFDDGFTATYLYDPAGRVKSVTNQDTALWTADQIDAAGRVVGEHYGGGATQAYDYDLIGFPSHITVARPSGLGTLYEVTVKRTSFGAPSIVTDLDNQGQDENATFQYDGAGRLTQSTLGTGDQQFTFTYSYDGLENMTSRGVVGPADIGVLVGRYQYGERGYGRRQLTSVVPGGAP